MKKRILSMFLSLCMATCLTITMPVSAKAETKGYYTYTVSGGKAVITECSKYLRGNLIIPATLGGYPVTKIGDFAFADCYDLLSVILPDSITEIGNSAFACCSDLTNVVIPNSVKSIGSEAFSECVSLTDIKIPNSITCISEGMFTSCDNLTNVTLPDSATVIENNAFANCGSLTSIKIPNRVKSIGEEAFLYCLSLTTMVLPKSLTDIGYRAFYRLTELTDVYYAGTEEDLEKINIEDRNDDLFNADFYYESYVETKGYYRYIVSDNKAVITGCDSSVYGAEIPSHLGRYPVTSIDENTFENCYKLTSIIIPKNITDIGRAALLDCLNLTDVYYAGTKEDWEKINIGDYNDVILSNAEIHYESNAKNEGYYTYSISDGKASVISFNYSGWGIFVIPSELGRCPVTEIKENAFADCSLMGIIIPGSVTSIETAAFDGCDSLTEIYYEGTEDDWENINIGDYNEALLNAEFYYESTGDEILYGYDIFDENAVITEYHESAEKLIIPSKLEGYPVTNIAYGAFLNCSGVKNITIPDSVTNIEGSAFESCFGLINVNIPDSVTNIGDCAFLGCDSLRSITIPNNITNIDEYTFENCYSLANVKIPKSVTNISVGAFNGCEILTNVYYAGTKEEWEKINIEEYNEALLNARIHYESTGFFKLDNVDKDNDGMDVNVKEDNGVITIDIKHPDGNPDRDNVMVYIAEYDENGTLLELTKFDKNDIDDHIKFLENVGIRYKILLWNDGQNPLINAVTPALFNSL